MKVEHQIIRASAGTGKTYNLVDRYVRLLAQGLEPAAIVVITFTRKAARELRGRISRQLVTMQFPLAVQEKVARAPISNFHGMCLRWLAKYSSEPRHADPSSLLANQADAMLFEQACYDAWQTCQTTIPGDWAQLAQYLHIERDFPSSAWSALCAYREGGFAPEQLCWPTLDVQQDRQQLHRLLWDTREQLRQHGVLSGKGEQNRQQLCTMPIGELDDGLGVWLQRWQTWLDTIDLRTGVKKLIATDLRDELRNGLAGIAAIEVVAPLQPMLQQLLLLAWQNYQQAKQAQGALDFVDIIAETVRLMEQDLDCHRGIRQQIQAVLVDEAQDTNGLQRRLVHLLTGLEGPAAKLAPPATLVVVGDWKQCIYTFRGADPASFAAFGQDIEHLQGKSYQLTISRRSSPAMVAGINHLGQALFGSAYEPLAPWLGDDGGQSAPLSEPQPPAWFWLDTTPLLPPSSVDKKSKATAESEGHAIAGWLRDALAKGGYPQDYVVLMPTMTNGPVIGQVLQSYGIPYVLAGGGGLFAQAEIQDILALLRWLLASQDGLSAAIALRSPLFACSDAQLLWLAQTAAGQSGWQRLADGLFDAATLAPQQQDGADLWQVQQWMQQWRQQLWVSDVAALMTTIWQTTDAWAVYEQLAGGLQAKANGAAFCALAQADGQRYQDGLVGFLRRLQERMALGLDEPLPPIPMGEQGAVLLSSVHQSKGLEYKHVLLAGLSQGGRNSSEVLRSCQDGTWVFLPRSNQQRWSTKYFTQAQAEGAQAQLEERKRVLYVAMTRAKESLVLVGPSEKLPQRGWGQWLGPWRQQAVADGVLQMISAQPLAESTMKASNNAVVRYLPASLPVAPPARWSFNLIDVAAQLTQQEGFERPFDSDLLDWQRCQQAILPSLLGTPTATASKQLGEQLWPALAGWLGLCPARTQRWQQHWTTWLQSAQAERWWQMPASQRCPNWQRVVSTPLLEQTIHWQLSIDLFACHGQGLVAGLLLPEPVSRAEERYLDWQLLLLGHLLPQGLDGMGPITLGWSCLSEPSLGWERMMLPQDHRYVQLQLQQWLFEHGRIGQDWLLSEHLSS